MRQLHFVAAFLVDKTTNWCIMVVISTNDRREAMNKSIGRLISILYRKGQIYSNTALKQYNLTSAEQPFLLCLYKNDGMTQEELSNYLMIDKASTARAVKSLMEKGFIKKKKNDLDKRCNNIYLTERSFQIEDKIKKELQNWSDFLTEDFDENTIKMIILALEKMVEKVEKKNLKGKRGK